eukprot:758060-Hanusia_phi.AAC.4
MSGRERETEKQQFHPEPLEFSRQGHGSIHPKRQGEQRRGRQAKNRFATIHGERSIVHEGRERRRQGSWRRQEQQQEASVGSPWRRGGRAGRVHEAFFFRPTVTRSNSSQRNA